MCDTYREIHKAEMDKKYLIQRRQGWYVRVRVSPKLYPLVGKHFLVKSLKTRDIEEARALRWAVVAEMKSYLSDVAKGKEAPSGSVSNLLNTAREIRHDLRNKSGTSINVEDWWYDTVDRFVSDNFKFDEQGDPIADSPEKREVLKMLTLANSYVYSPDSTRLSDALRDNLSELEQRARKQTVTARKRRVEQFSKWLSGDSLIHQITRAKAGQYLTDVLMKQGSSVKTIKDTLGDLSAFFNWALTRGLTENNPFIKLSSTVKDSSRGTKANVKRRNWNEDELTAFFTKVDTSKAEWTMSVIALYTGMRSNEIAETELKDVYETHIHIPEGKTESSVRDVPLHAVIKPLVTKLKETSADGYLIENLKRGGEDDKRNHYFVKNFGRKIRTLGIEDRGVVFHSFRKNFSTRLENAGITLNIAQQIVGHKKQSLTYGLYSQGVDMNLMVKAVGKVKHGVIDKLVKKEIKAGYLCET
jgi:integrase